MPKFVRQGDNTLTGNNTFSGDNTFSGALDATGTLKIGGVTVTATAAELNNAADTSANVETVAATNVIAASESGTTYFLNHATEFASTLPTPAAGLRFSFIVANAPESANYTIVTASGTDLIHGMVVCSQDAGGTADSSAGTAADTITFVAAKAVLGDRVDVICDGTNWFAVAYSSVFDAITFTQT